MNLCTFTYSLRKNFMVCYQYNHMLGENMQEKKTLFPSLGFSTTILLG